MIKKVSIDELNQAIALWNSGKLDEDIKLYALDGTMWITLDNYTGECYIEEFESEDDAIKWLEKGFKQV